MSRIAARIAWLVVVAASCSRPDPEPGVPVSAAPIGDVDTAPLAAPEMRVQDGGPVLDAQILGVTRAQRAAGLEQAALARQLARDPRVKELADRVVKDEAEAAAEEQAIAEPSRLSAITSLDSATIEATGKRTLMGMTVASSTELDRIYLGAQIRRLRTFLDLLDGTLIPNASTPALRTYLEAIRAVTAAQLKAALSIARSPRGRAELR